MHKKDESAKISNIGLWDVVAKTEKAKQKAISLILKFEGLKPEECDFYENEDVLIIRERLKGWDIAIIHNKDFKLME